MRRLEMICRGLAGVFLLGGAIGLALYILWTFGDTRPIVNLLVASQQDMVTSQQFPEQP